MNKNKLYNNILDLCIYQEIENSKNFLESFIFRTENLSSSNEFLEKEKSYNFKKRNLRLILKRKNVWKKELKNIKKLLLMNYL